MPSDIKICSLYLSIFPKGRKLSRKRLIRRWIAEGFVREKQGLSVEDVAETCFNQLIERKIMRPVEHSSNGRVKSCQVHDMVLEYIISKAAEEDFITVVGSHWSMPTRSNKVRRLSLHNSDPRRTKSVDRMNMSHVRSLTVFGSMDKLQFKSLKTELVQVLDLEGCTGLRESHVKVSDICQMIQLKYLSLRRTDIKELPPKVSKLRNLETLDVRETGIEIVEGSTTTASDIGYFTGLRKLAIYMIHKSDEIFRDFLSSIQYLSGYSLQTLVIDDKSSEFLKTLDSMSSYPTDLRALELSGKLLKLPKWLNGLQELVKLTLSGTALRTDNLLLLRNLSSLFSLTFSISKNHDPEIAAILEKNKSGSGGEIFVPAGGFRKLKLLRIFVPLLPSLNFAKNATPQLEKLELRFKMLEGLHGLDELGMLHDVLLTVDTQANEMTKLRVDYLKKEKTPSSKYTLNVNKYHD
ncbi:disease resistance protein RPM1-like [Setaria italica]|uniref:disease resistance protein RPM1-like n=1 Tax=Setaria italica TaxID=4555 RepID=UPI000BE55CEE|nr:disease resistance protein RPM1-like [Setaria italica]